MLTYRLNLTLTYSTNILNQTTSTRVNKFKKNIIILKFHAARILNLVAKGATRFLGLVAMCHKIEHWE